MDLYRASVFKKPFSKTLKINFMNRKQKNIRKEVNITKRLVRDIEKRFPGSKVLGGNAYFGTCELCGAENE